MVKLTSGEKRKVTSIKQAQPDIAAKEIMETLGLPANKQKALAAHLGVLARKRKSGSGTEPEEPRGNHSEGGNHHGSSGCAKVVEPLLTTPGVVDAIAEKALGKILPHIQGGHGGTPAVPQCPPAVSFTDAELALKVFDMLEAGSSFVDVRLSWMRSAATQHSASYAYLPSDRI